MADALILAPVLDLNAAEPLKAELLARRGGDLALDASSVERLGGLCLQVLLSAIRTWRADGVNLSFSVMSESFADQWAAFGAPAIEAEGAFA